MAFMAATLYFLDRALMQDSPALMLASILSLYLALMTHYCALIFALSVGCYALLRLASLRPRSSVASLWVVGQIGGIALAAFFWKTHITLIRRVGMVQHVAESYLRGSLFQRGQEIDVVLRQKIDLAVGDRVTIEGDNIVAVLPRSQPVRSAPASTR